MALSRRIARPLLASMFIVGGVDAVRSPGGKAKAAEAVTGPLSDHVGFVPNDPELLVRVNGAVQVGGGLLLATGRLPRLASLALIGSIVPTTYAGHRFWEEADERDRAQQRIHFLKNLGLLGGLLLAAVDTEGAPSLGWRARRRALRAGRAVVGARTLTAARTAEAVSDAARAGSRAARRGRRRADRRVSSARGRTQRAGVQAHEVGDRAVSATRGARAAAVTAAQEIPPVVLRAAHAGAVRAEPVLASGVDLASGILDRVGAPHPVH